MRTHDLSGPNMQEIKEANGPVAQNVCTLAHTARASRYPHTWTTPPATIKAWIDKTQACFFAEQVMGLDLAPSDLCPNTWCLWLFHARTSFYPVPEFVLAQPLY
jgi:hypothetical protein